MIENVDTPADAEAGYAEVHDLIFDQVYKFRRRFGGDFDDLLGEAHVAFMKGHNQYMGGTTPTGQPIAHSYATEIRRWVWYELFDAMRTRVARNARTPIVSLGEHDPAGPAAAWDAADWAAELGQDARYAVGLVLDPPEEVAATAAAKGGAPRNYRSTVRAYLRAEGWPPARINDAFEEIRLALG